MLWLVSSIVPVEHQQTLPIPWSLSNVDAYKVRGKYVCLKHSQIGVEPTRIAGKSLLGQWTGCGWKRRQYRGRTAIFCHKHPSSGFWRQAQQHSASTGMSQKAAMDCLPKGWMSGGQIMTPAASDPFPKRSRRMNLHKDNFISWVPREAWAYIQGLWTSHLGQCWSQDWWSSLFSSFSLANLSPISFTLSLLQNPLLCSYTIRKGNISSQFLCHVFNLGIKLHKFLQTLCSVSVPYQLHIYAPVCSLSQWDATSNSNNLTNRVIREKKIQVKQQT